MKIHVTVDSEGIVPRVLRHLAELVKDLALLTLPKVRIARRQRPEQVIPTGWLHLADLTFGRII